MPVQFTSDHAGNTRTQAGSDAGANNIESVLSTSAKTIHAD